MAVKNNAPPDIDGFITYHQAQGQLETDYQHLTHLQHFDEVKNAIGDDVDVITFLEEIIRRWRQYLNENEAHVELAAQQISAIEKETNKYIKSREEWLPIYHSALLEKLLSSNPIITAGLEEKKNDMLMIRSVFEEFFSSSIKKLNLEAAIE